MGKRFCGSRPNYTKVRDKVSEVFKNNFITPPINARQLASEYGLDVLFTKFPEEMSKVCGFIDFNNSKMYVNANDSTNRQNFTIAHELGHWLLHKDEIMENPSEYKILMRQPIGGETDPKEKEANTFAAELLVPADKLKELKRKGLSNSKIAELFVVSEQVIGYRLSNVGL